MSICELIQKLDLNYNDFVIFYYMVKQSVVRKLQFIAETRQLHDIT